MFENILQKIIDKKKSRLLDLKIKRPLNSLLEHSADSVSYYNFKEAIEKRISDGKISLIAESKKASPSAGLILDDYNPLEIAKIYQSKKATCLSILTEEDFFLGNLSHIYKIKRNSNAMENTGITLPILCKDFFIDTYQIHLSKHYGADAILIILAGVSDELADDLYNEALKLKMSVIVEVHTIDEAKRALRFKDALIGINNRDLKTLKTNINTTYDIHDILLKHTGPLISESGIKNKDEVLELSEKTNIKTFLIGESLLKNLDKNSIFSIL